MVKVLRAAPASRWKKIYRLSRRAPPDYFWERLGVEVKESGKAEFLEVDFLGATIAETLRGGGVQGGSEF